MTPAPFDRQNVTSFEPESLGDTPRDALMAKLEKCVNSQSGVWVTFEDGSHVLFGAAAVTVKLGKTPGGPFVEYLE